MCKKAMSLTFLSVWHESSFPFPVLNGAENNMVDFSLKENDSFLCVWHSFFQSVSFRWFGFCVSLAYIICNMK